MTNIRIPPRQDFDVSEQVYEWFRSLSTTIQQSDANDESDSINSLLGFFKGIESEFNELKNQLDTTEFLSAKIRALEETISLLPEESELSLYKAFTLNDASLSVKTYEYTGTFAISDLLDDINITEILGEGECFIEVAKSQAISSSALVTCRFINSTTIRLERGQSADDVQYVLKVKDYRNG